MVKAEAERRLVPALEESIERKLNQDGRWWGAERLPFRDIVLRLSSLTEQESDYLGARMGWDQPFFDGVDWDAVPTRLLVLVATSRLLTEDLRAMYPTPVATDQEEQP